MRTKKLLWAAALLAGSFAGATSLWPSLSPSVARAGEGGECPPHAHVVMEKDPDEGAMMRRCVCDAGWDADGPAPPCKAQKGKDAKKDAGKKK